MGTRALKDYMPRSLYGRAALIVLVPVVTLLVVFSVAFIQRLYDDVTRQMTRAVATDLTYVLDRIAADPEDGSAVAASVAAPLGVSLDFAPGPVVSDREWIDFTGGVVTETLQAEVPEVRAVDLMTRPGQVRVLAVTAAGPAEMVFSRRLVSARNPHQLLVIMGLTAMVMTVVSFLYLRGQVRPITRLAIAAEAFGKGETVPFRPAGAAEVRAAGGAFLDMRHRIERAIEQRTLMLSGVSHDLRTPLTRMKLALSMMEETEETRDLARDVAEMEKMLASFLDFAKSDAQEATEPVDPVALARDAVERGRRSGWQVDLGEAAPSATVSLRPHGVERALDNLVSNAARHGTRVRLGVTVTDRAVCFTVEDDGPGIPEDKRDAALKPFHRLDPARNQDRGGAGVGLGLAIAADVARSHGGLLRLGTSAELGGLMADLLLARSGNFDLRTGI